MPVYSETISDERILRILGNKYRRVLLVGCGACMNESLAYKNDLPIYKGSPDFPYATAAEVSRIEKLLKTNGYEVEKKTYDDIDGFYCMTDISSAKYPVDWTITPDIILILSCGAGLLAIRDKLPEMQVMKIAKQRGYLSYGFNDTNDQRTISKSDSAVIPFTTGG